MLNCVQITFTFDFSIEKFDKFMIYKSCNSYELTFICIISNLKSLEELPWIQKKLFIARLNPTPPN